MAKEMMQRIGTTSALYQMFDELQDVYVFVGGCLRRYEEVPKRYVQTLVGRVVHEEDDAAVFTISFQYREGFSRRHRDVFDPERVVVPYLPAGIVNGGFAYEHLESGWDSLNFIHPVIESHRYVRGTSLMGGDKEGDANACTRLLNTPFHLLEDIRTEWSRPLELVPLVEWLLVRTFSNPCEFDAKGAADVKKVLKTYWKLFMMSARDSGSIKKDDGNTITKDQQEKQRRTEKVGSKSIPVGSSYDSPQNDL